MVNSTQKSSQPAPGGKRRQGRRGGGMTPGCFDSSATHCKSEAMAKADMGQGFKDPERQARGTEPPAGPSPFSDANACTLHTKRFCPRTNSVNLALRFPFPAFFGDPPVASRCGLMTCPCISVSSTGIRGPLGNIPASDVPASLSCSPHFTRCCCKAF